MRTWAEDFSSVRAGFAQLRSAGVQDLERHLLEHPDELARLAALVRISVASPSAAHFFGVTATGTSATFEGSLGAAPSSEVFARQLSAMWRGEAEFHALAEFREPRSGRLFRGLLLAGGLQERDAPVAVCLLDLGELGDRLDAEARERASLERVFELVPDMVCVADEHGRLLRVNRAWETTLGRRREEFVDRPLVDFVHPEDVARTREALQRVLKGQSVTGFVNRYLREDGTARWIEWTSSSFQTGQVVGVGRDVTERRQAEEERQEHLAFLKGLAEFDRAIRQAQDLEQMMESALDAALALFGSDRVWLIYPCDPDAPSWKVPMERTRAHYPGAFQEKAVLPMVPEAAEVFRAALASEGPLAFDPRSGRPLPAQVARRYGFRSQVVMAVHPKLRKPWLLGMHQCSHARIWSDADLRLFREIGRRLADAVTSMTLLEDLRASESKHKLLIEATNTGYVILDGEGRLTDANEEYLRLAGRRALDELRGRPMSEWTQPADRERLARGLAQCLEQGLVRDLEVDYLAPGGQVTPVALDAARLSAPSGVSVMAVCRDVTERRRAQDELREEARRKDEFLAMLGHELRNPMAPIRNAIALLQRLGSPDPRARRARDIIERQTAHLSRIVDDLLDVSRIARGKISLRREPVEWGRVARDAVEDARSGLEAKGIALHLDLAEEPLRLEGDATRLAQVLSNLLHNAEKFTDRGGTVRVELRRTPDGRAAAMTVADTGVGMDRPTLGRLFQPFAQARMDLARSRGGLGLGLALVKGLVQLHGGTIEAASEGPGRGSRFTVRLPLLASPAERTGFPAPARRAPSRRRRVLIVEDNPDAAESLKALLEEMGHEVRTAPDGASALALARVLRPDAVLCDLGLPGGLDGYGVAAAIRADAALRDALLVAVTGYGQLEDRRKSAQARFDLHLTKPVEPEELERVLGSGREEAAPPPA